MDAAEVRALLKAQIEASGLTQAGWAAQHGVQPSALSETLSGARKPGPRLLAVMGLRRVRTDEYEEVGE